jgi:alanine-glyoxylate transaminase/serine-glyoxylate transaminase/serine-pyruvate transaminase
LPPGIEDAFVRSVLLREFGIEIGGGLGALHGKAWRIGLMGESSTRANVLMLLSALEEIFLRRSWTAGVGRALDAASQVYSAQSQESQVEEPVPTTHNGTR